MSVMQKWEHVTVNQVSPGVPADAKEMAAYLATDYVSFWVGGSTFGENQFPGGMQVSVYKTPGGPYVWVAGVSTAGILREGCSIEARSCGLGTACWHGDLLTGLLVEKVPLLLDFSWRPRFELEPALGEYGIGIYNKTAHVATVIRIVDDLYIVRSADRGRSVASSLKDGYIFREDRDQVCIVLDARCVVHKTPAVSSSDHPCISPALVALSHISKLDTAFGVYGKKLINQGQQEVLRLTGKERYPLVERSLPPHTGTGKPSAESRLLLAASRTQQIDLAQVRPTFVCLLCETVVKTRGNLPLTNGQPLCIHIELQMLAKQLKY